MFQKHDILNATPKKEPFVNAFKYLQGIQNQIQIKLFLFVQHYSFHYVGSGRCAITQTS